MRITEIDFPIRGHREGLVFCHLQSNERRSDAGSLRTCRVNAATYSNLVIYYLNLNRLEEARTTAEEAQAKKLDSPSLPINLYRLAFLQSDSGGMTQHVAWAAGKPGVENILLAYEAETAAYSSQLRKARELSRRALASAERAKAREAMAGYEARAALREALIGTAAQARRRAASGARVFDGSGCAVWSGSGAGLGRGTTGR